MCDNNQANDGETNDEQRTGEWLGTVNGLTVRAPAEDADHPVLVIRGDDGLAAMEVPPEITDAMSHAMAELDMAREDGEPEVRTDGGKDTATEGGAFVETPFTPDGVNGTITPRENGYRADLPCASEWLTETENGDLLQRAVDRAAREYGNGVTVRVRWTDDGTGIAEDFTIIGPEDDDD